VEDVVRYGHAGVVVVLRRGSLGRLIAFVASVGSRVRLMRFLCLNFANMSFSCSVSQSLTSHVLLKLGGVAE
jgi:hypothetical protein